MAISKAALALMTALLAAGGPKTPTAKEPHLQAPTSSTIPFTEGILTLGDISRFTWQNWTQLFPLNAHKYPIRVEADGSLEYLAANDAPSLTTPGSLAALESQAMAKYAPDAPVAPGTPLYHVRIRQALRAGDTERFVSFTITNSSEAELLKLEFLTEGTELKEVPAEQLGNGLLPFNPNGLNERTARTTIVLLGTERVTTSVRKETLNGVDYTEAMFAQGAQNSLFFMYREWSSPSEHRLYYHYTSTQGADAGDWDWAAGTTFEVRKLRKPGDLLGSEYFWVNHEVSGMTTFQNTFTKVVLTPLAQNWQQGFGSFAGFIFLPGFSP